MTEYQMKQLKKILQRSDAVDSSSELDETILREARQRASDYSQTRTSFFSFFQADKVAGFGVLSSATVAFATTLLTLYGLSQLAEVETPEAELESLSGPIIIEFRQTASTSPEKPAVEQVIEVEPPTRPDARKALDQWLADTSLPPAETWLSEIDLSLSNDPDFTRRIVAQAFEEIRFLLIEGQIDSARSRYARLIQRCSDCELPESLEVLVQTGNG